jgi:hypothetical protein
VLLDQVLQTESQGAEMLTDPLAVAGIILEVDGRYCCSVCNKSYAHRSDCNRHLSSHSRAQICHICKKTFAREENLQRHMNKHLGSIKCPACMRAYGSKYSLRIHLDSGKCEGFKVIDIHD